MPPRLLPTLLPSRWTAADARGQLWNTGPAHDRRRTVLDDVPTPTDQMLPGPPACSLKARSGGKRFIHIKGPAACADC